MSSKLERVARALCLSCKFDTGQGGCAPLCMSVLGDSRGGPHGCAYAVQVHGALAADIISAIGPDPRIAAAKALVAAPGWDSMYRLIEAGLNRDSLIAYNAFMPLLEARENLRKALENSE